jgi:hypothetical protein
MYPIFSIQNLLTPNVFRDMRSSEIFGEAEKFLNFRMSRVVRGSERSGEACAARACPKNVVQDAERSGVSWTTVALPAG